MITILSQGYVFRVIECRFWFVQVDFSPHWFNCMTCFVWPCSFEPAHNLIHFKLLFILEIYIPDGIILGFHDIAIINSETGIRVVVSVQFELLCQVSWLISLTAENGGFSSVRGGGRGTIYAIWFGMTSFSTMILFVRILKILEGPNVFSHELQSCNQLDHLPNQIDSTWVGQKRNMYCPIQTCVRSYLLL